MNIQGRISKEIRSELKIFYDQHRDFIEFCGGFVQKCAWDSDLVEQVTDA